MASTTRRCSALSLADARSSRGSTLLDSSIPVGGPGQGPAPDPAAGPLHQELGTGPDQLTPGRGHGEERGRGLEPVPAAEQVGHVDGLAHPHVDLAGHHDLGHLAGLDGPDRLGHHGFERRVRRVRHNGRPRTGRPPDPAGDGGGFPGRCAHEPGSQSVRSGREFTPVRSHHGHPLGPGGLGTVDDLRHHQASPGRTGRRGGLRRRSPRRWPGRTGRRTPRRPGNG